jgi:hypothetical protein
MGDVLYNASPMTTPTRSARQALFRDIVFGVLLYSVVLGFFNDYTDMLSTTSYSTTFLVAIVLQLLTLGTLWLKSWVMAWFRQRKGTKYPPGLIFSVWLIMFLSKFVFLGVIDAIFGSAVEVSGFVSIMVVIAVMMIAQQVIERFYDRLADAAS